MRYHDFPVYLEHMDSNMDKIFQFRASAEKLFIFTDTFPILITISLIPLTASTIYFFKIFQLFSIVRKFLWMFLVLITIFINPLILNYLIPDLHNGQFTYYPLVPLNEPPGTFNFKPLEESVTISINRSSINKYLEKALKLPWHTDCATEQFVIELDRIWPAMAYHSFKGVKIYLYIFPVYAFPLIIFQSLFNLV